MDKEIAAIVFGILAFFGMLFGTALYSDTMENQIKTECLKARGEYIGKVCIFRDHKPT